MRANEQRGARDGASDDHLSAYFHDLSGSELLSAEAERDLSRKIEENEIRAWELVFSRPEQVGPAVAFLFERLATAGEDGPPAAVVKRAYKVTDEVMATRRARRDPAILRRFNRVMRELAAAVRTCDLDRVHIDALVREHLPKHGEYASTVRAEHRAGAELRDQFTKSNLRLVVTMARRYDRGGMPLADLIQEGNLGLMHAVSRFDHRRGLRFSTFACWWIKHAIGRALADKARTVRIPVHMLESQQQVEKARRFLTGELGRPPTPEELAAHAKVSLDKLEQIENASLTQPISLDTSVRPSNDDSNEHWSFEDIVADPVTEESTPADDMTRIALTVQVKRLMHVLSPIEIEVLSKRFGLDDDVELTFREIGDLYHLSRERIRQIQNEGLKKLRRAMESERTALD